MKRDYKTVAEWKKAYVEKQELLEEHFKEVSPYLFYREMFPEGSFQEKGHPEQKKPNGIVTTKIQEACGVIYTNVSIMTDELDSLSFIYPREGKKPKGKNTQKLSLIAPCGFYGQHKSKAMLHNLFAIVIDIDYVGKQQLKNLIKQFGNGSRAIPPTYIVSSGKGVHLYYFLEEPLPMYHYYEEALSELKKDLIRWTWNETSSIRPEDRDMAGVSQAFRAVGSETKLGMDYITRAYKVTGNRYTVEQIKDWIGSKVDVDIDSWRKSYDEKHMSLAEAKEKYPEWYQKRIIEKKPPSEGKFTVKRDLYDWWIRKIKEEAKVGGRYYSIMALVAYGTKCDIPENEIRKDAFALLEHLESLTDDETNHFTKADIEDAFKGYKAEDSKLTFKLTRAFIEERTKIPIPENKRNGRKRPMHQAYRRSIKKFKEDNGEAEWDKGGRPDKQAIVEEWRKAHPDGKKADCIRDTGLDKKTVYKWWDGEPAAKPHKEPRVRVMTEKEKREYDNMVADSEQMDLKEELRLMELAERFGTSVENVRKLRDVLRQQYKIEDEKKDT